MACILDLNKLDCDVRSSIPAVKEFMRRKGSHYLSCAVTASARAKAARDISVQQFIKEFDSISNSEIVAQIKHLKLNNGVLTATVCSDLGKLQKFGLVSLSGIHTYVPRIWWSGSGPNRFISKLVCFDVKATLINNHNQLL